MLAVANHNPNSPNTVCGTAALPGASGTNGHLCATGWWPWMVAVPESTVLTLDPDSKDALDAESGIHQMDRWTDGHTVPHIPARREVDTRPRQEPAAPRGPGFY